jgi:hypothetical protein
LERGCPAEAVDQLCCNAIICVAVGTIVFIACFVALWNAESNADECGIDVWLWLQVQIGLITLSGLCYFPVLCYLRNNHPLKGVFCFLIIVLITMIAIAAHVIYGYFIYFSKSNECQKSEATGIALVFMCIFLIFGICQTCLAFCLLIAVPITYFMLVRPAIEGGDKKKA